MNAVSSPVVGIVAKPQPSGSLPLLATLLTWLEGRSLSFVLDPEAARLAGQGPWQVRERELIPSSSDLVVVLGGDGTLLSVARHMRAKEVPILGVNLGSLGFLTEVSAEEMLPVLEEYLAGKIAVQRRLMLRATLSRDGSELARFHCLNDVVVNKAALARIIAIRVEIGGVWLTDMRADGVIVSTPTGSTGYNLSAGGPILVPALDGIVISPLCPHTLTMRPLIVDRGAPIDIILLQGAEQVYLTADGQLGHPLSEGDRVRIEPSEHAAPLIVNPRRTYYGLIREKLGWGSR